MARFPRPYFAYRPRVEQLESRVVATTLPPGFTESIVTGGLEVPAALEFAPDGRIFVSEIEGRVRVIKNGQLLPTPFVTVQTKNTHEGGLMGIAFHPDFAENGYLYLYYTSPNDWPHQHISRFKADPANPDRALPNSEEILFEVNNEPISGHLGGQIGFGIDEKLYIPIGDNYDPQAAQNIEKTNGKLLRVNDDGSVPGDNPFVHIPWAQHKTWAMGFRNPFSFAIQPGTGRVFVNDVGSDPPNRREEVNFIVKGGNYGWPLYEGYTTDPDFESPLFAYDGNFAGGSCSITGGAFYNPPINQFPPKYVGKYFFTDFCGRWIYYLNPDAADPKSTVTAFASELSAVSPIDVTVAPNGDLYYLDNYKGEVLRITFRRKPVTPMPLPTVHGGKPATSGFEWRATLPAPANPEVALHDRDEPSASTWLDAGVARFTTADVSIVDFGPLDGDELLESRFTWSSEPGGRSDTRLKVAAGRAVRCR